MSEAFWALTGVVVGTLASGVVNLVLQNRQFKQERAMYVLENQGTENVKSLLLEMLSHRSYTDRSFDAIRMKVGGYTDDEIKQLLHEVGAKKTSRNNGEEEWWFLADREPERIEKRQDRA